MMTDFPDLEPESRPREGDTMGVYLEELRTLVGQAVKRDGRGPFSRALGYRNSAKGIRRIEKFLAGVDKGEDLLCRIAVALHLEPNIMIRKVVEELERDCKQEIAARIAKARAEFQPHLFVETERTIPSPIFAAIVSGAPSMRFVPVRSENMSHEEIGEIIRRHYESSKGVIITFGKITGYRYQQTYDNGMKFDTDGRFIGPFEAAAKSIPPMMLSYKGREIPPGVFRNCTT